MKGSSAALGGMYPDRALVEQHDLSAWAEPDAVAVLARAEKGSEPQIVRSIT